MSVQRIEHSDVRKKVAELFSFGSVSYMVLLTHLCFSFQLLGDNFVAIFGVLGEDVFAEGGGNELLAGHTVCVLVHWVGAFLSMRGGELKTGRDQVVLARGQYLEWCGSGMSICSSIHV